MATLLFSINPEDPLESVTIATGPAITTKNIELNVDLGADVADANAAVTPRAIKKGEVLKALLILQQAVLRNTTIPE